MKDWTRRAAVLCAAVAFVGILLGCGGDGVSERRTVAATGAAGGSGVGWETSSAGLLPDNYGHVGVVVRERRVVVPAPYDARLLERFVRPGDAVRTGQPLARFDSDSADRALVVAEAAVTEAEAAVKVALVEVEQSRARHERRQGRPELFSLEQLAEVRAEMEVSLARLESSRARLAAARASEADARAEARKALLRSPMDGVVDAVYGSPGMYDTRGAPVAAIEAGEWHVRFAAPPEAAIGFPRGALVSVLPEDHEPVQGFVIFASPELDPRTLLLTFEARLCADDLPAGTAVRVSAVPEPEDGRPPPDCSAPLER